MDAGADVQLRDHLAQLLESGLETDWQRRAYDDAAIHEVLHRLREVAAQDYPARLKIAGFKPLPYQPPEDAELEQSCSTCMYYECHRAYCNLPELGLPVKPQWSCVLWRI